MNKYKTECIVLKALNYKDADKIYTLFSREHGKISAIAHGVRKISSRRAGSLDTLNHIVVELSENHKNFKTITEVKLQNGFGKLKDNYDIHVYVYDVISLISQNMEEDSSDVSEAFDLLLETILNLQKSDNPQIREFVLNSFRMRFFDILGYRFSPDALSTAARYQLTDQKLKVLDLLKVGRFDSSINEHEYRSTYGIVKAFVQRV